MPFSSPTINIFLARVQSWHIPTLFLGENWTVHPFPLHLEVLQRKYRLDSPTVHQWAPKQDNWQTSTAQP